MTYALVYPSVASGSTTRAVRYLRLTLGGSAREPKQSALSRSFRSRVCSRLQLVAVWIANARRVSAAPVAARRVASAGPPRRRRVTTRRTRTPPVRAAVAINREARALCPHGTAAPCMYMYMYIYVYIYLSRSTYLSIGYIFRSIYSRL